jgi:hypothetical protein
VPGGGWRIRLDIGECPVAAEDRKGVEESLAEGVSDRINRSECHADGPEVASTEGGKCAR